MSASHVRRDKGGAFQWVQAPPGSRHWQPTSSTLSGRIAGDAIAKSRPAITCGVSTKSINTFTYWSALTLLPFDPALRVEGQSREPGELVLAPAFRQRTKPHVCRGGSREGHAHYSNQAGRNRDADVSPAPTGRSYSARCHYELPAVPGGVSC